MNLVSVSADTREEVEHSVRQIQGTAIKPRESVMSAVLAHLFMLLVFEKMEVSQNGDL